MGTPRSLSVVVTTIAVATVLTSCGAGSTARTRVLAGSPMSVCPRTTAAMCGRLTVPENRADPEGRTIQLNVMVVPAEDAHPAADPVFFLAGGPGGAATETWLQAYAMFPGIHAHRDIVLVDQRGTGDSNLLRWPDVPDFSRMSRAEVLRRMHLWMSRAIDSLDADPRLYTSSQAADDLDDVRAALGYETIDVYGGSYGATLAQYYVRQHADHVRAVVLDGGTLLDVPLFELIARNSQRALDEVFQRCAADEACSKAFPHPAAELARAMTRLSAHPVRSDERDPWSGKRIVVDAAALAAEIHYLLVTSSSRVIPLTIHLAATGDLYPVAQLIRAASEDPATASQGMVMYWSIVCGEGWARFDPARVEAVSDGSYLASNQLESARDAALACGVMPRPHLPAGDGAPIRSEIPVLLLNGAEDPQDPPSNVRDAPRELQNSLAVAVPAVGHTVGHIGCLPDVVAAFFEAGSVAGLDTSCVRQMSPSQFATNWADLATYG